MSARRLALALLVVAACGDDTTMPMRDAAAMADLAVPVDDMAQLPDVAMPDLATPDLAMPDLATPDLATPDLALPDLALPDLARAPVADMTMAPPVDMALASDLAMPDLAVPDLAMPDLATPDLAMPDLWSPPDLLPPALVLSTTHRGPAAVTCCIVTHPSGAVLYLVNPSAGGGIGELHLWNGATDTTLAPSSPLDGYGFTPDGKSAVFLTPASSGEAALEFAPVASPGSVATVISDGVPAGPLATASFWSPSGRYLLVGVSPPNVAVSKDLHIVDATVPKDVLDYGNGAYDYYEVVGPDDTMYFQDLVGGTSISTGGVQTLFRISLPAGATGTQPTAITTHTSDIALTPDGSLLVYDKTDASMWLYDTASAAVTQLPATAVRFTVGPLAKGPIAYLAADRSLHVWSPSTGAEVYASAAGTADLFSPLVFSSDGKQLFFFKNVDSENNHGDLWHVTPATGNTPALVAAKTVLSLVWTPAAGRVVFGANPDTLGHFASLTASAYDGSNAVTLATGAYVWDVLGDATSGTTYVASLGGAHAEFGRTPVDGTDAVVGALGLAPSTSASEVQVDPSVHTGAYEFSDDGAWVAYVGGASWDGTASNYVGGFALFDVAGARPAVASPFAGVSEIGPVGKRHVFVNAPLANPAGLYEVTW